MCVRLMSVSLHSREIRISPVEQCTSSGELRIESVYGDTRVWFVLPAEGTSAHEPDYSYTAGLEADGSKSAKK